MEVTIIVAVAKNGVIGDKGQLPWQLREDLRRFSKLTVGNTVVMGRKTFESILARNGKPLPNRQTIVVTHQAGYSAPAAGRPSPVYRDPADTPGTRVSFLCL